jgi:hypothetical protein
MGPVHEHQEHWDFDPFATASEKVRRDDVAPTPTRCRARSFSQIRGATPAPTKSLNNLRFACTEPVPAQQKGKKKKEEDVERLPYGVTSFEELT